MTVVATIIIVIVALPVLIGIGLWGAAALLSADYRHRTGYDESDYPK